MSNKVLCLYHKNCMDGFSSAWVVGRKYGFENVEFIEAKYGSKLPDFTGRDVVIVDFSYKPAVLKPLFDKAKSILMLDHHKSAFEDWDQWTSNSGLAWGGFITKHPDESFEAEIRPTDNVRIIFKSEMSGAGITWNHFFPDHLVPRFIEHAQDYDLWHHVIPNSVELIAGLWDSDQFKKQDFQVLTDMLDPDKYNEMLKIGTVIEKTKNNLIRSMIATGNHRFVKMIPEAYIPVMHLSSTLANHAGTHLFPVALKRFEDSVFTHQDLIDLDRAGGLFTATYTENWEDKRRTFSLRSNKTHTLSMDVTKVSRRFGGGGHKNSSGFSVPIQVPVHLLFNQGLFTRAYVKVLVWFYTKLNQSK